MQPIFEAYKQLQETRKTHYALTCEQLLPYHSVPEWGGGGTAPLTKN